MIQVLVVGGTGMLGSMLVDVLSKNPNLRVRSTFNRRVLETFPANVQQIRYTACRGLPQGIRAALRPKDWIVNAVGAAERGFRSEAWVSRNGGSDPAFTRAAIEANALLPLELLDVSQETGCSVLQVATDCVYSGLGGEAGSYVERCPHDATSVYGKTKSLGEVRGDRFFNLRCSLVGPEPCSGGKFLLEQFLAHPHGARVDGYINHRWNGVTTLAFAKIAEAIVLGEVPELVRDQHLLPFDQVSNYVLLLELSRLFRRFDLEISPGDSGDPFDRTLGTMEPHINDSLWRAAGYYGPPKICELLEQLAKHSYFFKRPSGDA